ncbi:GAF domain-containing sensor histidine kinase (plasmid) [Deinococcus sp. KNUC1210]|uniref:GAF domain-containing sensor histidine kinase n=1 Tax=Deinococcus sp. KNUC1210 TaxID=2917691 RepID=UPI001EEFA4FC|nr:GAF domain-containing sensor histidine kinase [Deinococcus sp. KNUC1210]ULH17206.1 GAF domain-containing sensor histidine kinase [Deinococcus sp. KNUC1210]
MQGDATHGSLEALSTRSALLVWLDVWGVPALLLLAGAAVVNTSLHAHWLDLVWNVRNVDETRWPAAFTRARLWLDGAQPLLGALGAALLWRACERRWWVVLAVLGLGVLDSQLWTPPGGAAGALAVGLPLLVIGAALVLGWRRRHTASPLVPPLLLWGYAAVLICSLVWNLGAAAPDPANTPLLWNELIRPSLRDLGMVVLVLCSALVVLEGSPGALRGSVMRGLVFFGLSLGTALVFTLVVGGLGALLHTQNSFWPSILAAALVAAGIDPARTALSRSVRRLLYGERDDPYAVMQRLSVQLEGPLGRTSLETGLQDALREVAQTLRLPALTLRFSDTEGLSYGALSYGTLPALAQTETLALIAQGERLGSLEVARRSPREAFTRSELSLLEGVARQLASAAHALQLADQLQTSQQELLRAGEEERRRLRRDLHDGLGPSLAGLGLKLEVARILLGRSPEAAAAHLDALKAEVQESVNEVRRLVHDLRPPKLDDLGLAGALEDLLGGVRQAGLTARLELGDALPALGAALEVAVYRIAQEALTNVMKHARASEVIVRLETVRPETGQQEQSGTTLLLSVQDNGVGLPDVREPGVGSRSMRERAGALSGTLELSSEVGGGTHVRARLPLQAPRSTPNAQKG